MVNSLTTAPFYLNWTFWSFVIAFTALILSQLPKVYLWTKGKKVDLEIHSRITVNHYLGIPALSIYMGVANKGRSKIKIKRIDSKITKDGKVIANLSCNSFFDTTSSQSPNLFFPFDLSSESSWDHSCWFTTDIDRNTEQKIRSSVSALDMNVVGKIKNNEDKDQLVEADEHFVKPLIDIKEKKFIWEPGEYFVEIVLETVPLINISKNIRFTLFETDTKELEGYSNDYKYGMPYHNQKNKGLNISISEGSIS
jgi:hypothetical protein